MNTRRIITFGIWAIYAISIGFTFVELGVVLPESFNVYNRIILFLVAVESLIAPLMFMMQDDWDDAKQENKKP